jgi:Nucleotidyl transferase/NAD dependent epimerase/dehydratase family
MHEVVPVILCGGSGARLWPLSRAGFSKQFLVLSSTTSLFQQAVERVNQLGAADIAVGTPWWSLTKRSVMPINLYGPGGQLHPENSHVIPGLIRRFHEAKLVNAPSVAIWGQAHHADAKPY